MLKPRALRPGDTIALVAPAGPVRDPRAWERLEARLQGRGYRVRRGRHAGGRLHYLAGTDPERRADLLEALGDPEVAAVFCARGGYGCMRLLPDLPLPERWPVFLGYSDITALHLFFLARGRLVFHGPLALPDLGAPRPHGPTLAHLWGMLEGTLKPPLVLPGFCLPGFPPRRTLRPGRARGPLVGGNLSLMAALMGSGLLPDLRGAILLLEDVDEAPYRLDRCLQQLRLAGILEGLAGLVLGPFTLPQGRLRPRYREELEGLYQDLGRWLRVPAFAGFPCGHEG
ncbi:MAG TPA: LD-carboxypeptidase, partial [Candidatus Nitrosotenuis sp.]|nr:LD-carboxypeptidase [Candidatus Nitrosotenuis sp.]